MTNKDVSKMTAKIKSLVREIDENYNERMLSVVENAPIEASGLKILFDRRPNIFTLPQLRSTKLRCAGFFIRDHFCGFAMMLCKEALVKGHISTILYFGNLVLDQAARGKINFYRIFDFFMQDIPDDMLGYMIIMQGNKAAERLINRRHPRYPNTPHSRIIGQWRVQNILLTFKKKYTSRYAVRQATMDDSDRIVRLLQAEYKTRLFAPHITTAKFLSDLEKLPNFSINNYYVAEMQDELVGVCCAWDMTPIKKNRVLQYGGAFKWVKTAYKLLTPIFKFPPLPEEGKPFRDVTISDYAVKNRNPDILRALLTRIYSDYREKKYHMIIFGCAANDAIQTATKPFLSQPVTSHIVLFSKSKNIVDAFDDPSLPYIDMALL